MLGNAIAFCPPELWVQDRKFYYLSYHTTIFLDYYLSHPVRDFKPLLPYDLHDPGYLPPDAVDDVLPGRNFTREEVLNTLMALKEKCRNLILHTPEAHFFQPWVHADEVGLHGLCPPVVENYTLLEILFYNFRHVQHHVAQLNMILRQKTGHVPDWVSRVE